MDFDVGNLPSMSTLGICSQGLITVDKEALTTPLIHLSLEEYLSAHPDIFSRPRSAIAEIHLTYLNSHPLEDTFGRAFSLYPKHTLPRILFHYTGGCKQKGNPRLREITYARHIEGELLPNIDKITYSSSRALRLPISIIALGSMDYTANRSLESLMLKLHTNRGGML